MVIWEFPSEHYFQTQRGKRVPEPLWISEATERAHSLRGQLVHDFALRTNTPTLWPRADPKDRRFGIPLLELPSQELKSKVVICSRHDERIRTFQSIQGLAQSAHW